MTRNDWTAVAGWWCFCAGVGIATGVYCDWPASVIVFVALVGGWLYGRVSARMSR